MFLYILESRIFVRVLNLLNINEINSYVSLVEKEYCFSLQISSHSATSTDRCRLLVAALRSGSALFGRLRLGSRLLLLLRAGATRIWKVKIKLSVWNRQKTNRDCQAGRSHPRPRPIRSALQPLCAASFIHWLVSADSLKDSDQQN